MVKGRLSSRPLTEKDPRREWASIGRCSSIVDDAYVPTKSEYASVRIEKNSTFRSTSRVLDPSDSGRTIELHGLINKRMRIPMARRICRSITNNLPQMTHLSLWVICLNNPIKTAELLSRPDRQRFPKHTLQQRDSIQRTPRCCQTSYIERSP